MTVQGVVLDHEPVQVEPGTELTRLHIFNTPRSVREHAWQMIGDGQTAQTPWLVVATMPYRGRTVRVAARWAHGSLAYGTLPERKDQ